MRRIAEGRASEIFDLGDGRVLRRFKSRSDPAREAELMALARQHGFPVPDVLELRGDGMVLDYIAGPTMAADAARQPLRLASHARTLAVLHDRLGQIRTSRGSLLHRDLHPKNVIMSPSGPVVIDWANAGFGERSLDPALTWVILATSAGRTGALFGRLFARNIDVLEGRSSAIAFRLADRNLTAIERRAVRKLECDARQPEQRELTGDFGRGAGRVP